MFKRYLLGEASNVNQPIVTSADVIAELTRDLLESSDEDEHRERINEIFDELEEMPPPPPQVIRRYTHRERVAGGIRLYKDYLASQPVFHDGFFRRRFRMRRSLFEEILIKVQEYDEYFTQRWQCTGEMGLTPYKKMTAAVRMLANGCTADTVDEYIKIGETTTYECLERFCRAVIKVYAREYLREPTATDMARLLEQNKRRGFPGMVGSVDCMHWRWKNCPKAWAGAYTSYKGSPSIILEAVASHDLWIWHIFFGMPSSCNDINVLNRSGIFDRMMRGQSPTVEFTVNRRAYQLPYYLGDGIYPKLATIVKTIPEPRNPKETLFSTVHESVRKDVKRAFGVLQARWAIIRQPARTWKNGLMHKIMTACVLLHNMIVQDERGTAPCEYDQDNAREPEIQPTRSSDVNYARHVARYAEIHNQAIHFQLKGDLVEHMWNESGNLL